MAREYKDSGIEWIGRIPKNWKTTSLKNTARGKNSLFIDGDWIESPHITNSGYRYLTTGNVGPLKYKEQGESYISEKSFRSLNCTRVYPGDLLIARLNEPIGRACVVPELGSPIVTAVNNVIYRPNEELTFKGFMLYMLNCPGFTDTANLMARGSTMHRLSRTMLGNLDIVIPPLAEQQRIADYLDEKCGEIDSLISLQEQMIAQLTDYKQSVITEAVTKGLDPNAQLVPSGIDWIGDIPKGWKVARIKNVASLYGRIGFRGYTSDDLNKDGVGAITLSPSNMLSMKMDYTNVTYLSWEKYYESPEIMIQNGDLLMVKTGSSYGKVSYVDNLPREATINPQILRIIPKIESKYLGFYLQTQLFLYQVDGGVVGGTIPTIAQEKINNFKVVLPSLDEQRTIADYLDKKCAEIDALITLKQQKIETLKNYKKSLIFEAVTGKIEVV